MMHDIFSPYRKHDEGAGGHAALSVDESLFAGVDKGKRGLLAAMDEFLSAQPESADGWTLYRDEKSCNGLTTIRKRGPVYAPSVDIPARPGVACKIGA